MIDNGQLCQVQGHKGFKLSHVCIFTGCLHTSRWLCMECVREQIHNHKDGINGLRYIRTKMEFMSDFKIKIQPLLGLKLNSLDGVQVKCTYLQKIFNDLKSLGQVQQQWNQEIIDNDIQILKETISSLIKLYQNEESMIEAIKKTFCNLNIFGLKGLTSNEIDFLIKINTVFFKEENLLFQKITYFIRKVDGYLQKQEYLYREFVIKIIQDATSRLNKLREYINYQEDHTFVLEDIHFDNIFISKNERYFAYLNQLDQIKIRELNSKKLSKSYNFTKHTYLISFEEQQRYLVIFDNQYNLCYYFLKSNNKQIRLIKKYYIGYYKISRLFIININKIMMIGQDWIQILNFRNRCVNQINLYDYDSTDIEIVFYGRIKGLIVITIIINDNQNILIYKENQKQPFIQQNVNIEQTIQINQISLASDDMLLITEDQYEIKLWQIDFQGYQLILINRMIIKQFDDYWFSYNSSDFNIILSQPGNIQILDKNFNRSYEITTQNTSDKVLLTEQFIILMDYGNMIYQNKINILRKGRTDYNKLE